MSLAAHRQSTEYWMTNGPVRLRRCVAKSGEGTVWKTDQPGMLAKIYHQPTPERAEKLALMIANPPQDPTQKDGFTSICWPKDIIHNAAGTCCGFVMPEIPDTVGLNAVYNPKLRKQKAPQFNWYYLHITALNIAWIVRALHAKKYVVGDIKSENFLVNQRAHVSIIDTDSFQITHTLQDVANKSVFRCPVGSEGFTPPELVGRDLKLVDRTEEHDRFGLAVLMHLLLLGFHPYSGTWEGEGDLPPRDKLVKMGHWVGMEKRSHPLAPGKLSVSYEVLDPKIYEAFKDAFDKGHTNPSARPSAERWMGIMEEALSHLVICAEEEGHFHLDSLDHCPWCARRDALSFDIFPSQKGASINPFILGKKFERALKKNDLRQILKQWDDYRVLRSHPDFSKHHSKIEVIRQQVSRLDNFRRACKSHRDDERTLWDLWKDEDLVSIAGIEHEEIDGTALPEYMASLRKRIDALEELESAITKAYGEQTKGALCEETEKKIQDLLIKYEDELKSSFTLKKYGLSRRVNEARSRLKQWHKLKSALDAQDDCRILMHWRSSPLLQNFGPALARKNQIDQAKETEAHLRDFVRCLNQEMPDDNEACRLWEMHPELASSTLTKQGHPNLDSRSPRLAAKEASKRLKVKNTLENLSQKTPLDFIGIADVWDTKLCATTPCFEKYHSLVEWTYAKSHQYRDLLVALKEQNYEKVRDLWDERNFPPLIQEHNMEEKIINAFKAQSFVPFQAPVFTPFERGKAYLKIKWQWPDKNTGNSAPVAIVALRSDRYPLTPEDVEHPRHMRNIWHTLYQKNGGITLPYTDKFIYASVWTGHIVCGSFVTVGVPLHLSNMEDKRIDYFFETIETKHRFKKGIKSRTLKLSIESKQNLSLPKMRLMRAENGPIAPTDRKLSEVATLPAVDLHAHVPMTVEFNLEDHSFSGPTYFQLLPVDPDTLNHIEFHHQTPKTLFFTNT